MSALCLSSSRSLVAPDRAVVCPSRLRGCPAVRTARAREGDQADTAGDIPLGTVEAFEQARWQGRPRTYESIWRSAPASSSTTPAYRWPEAGRGPR
jgi:hypothetical protein